MHTGSWTHGCDLIFRVGDLHICRKQVSWASPQESCVGKGHNSWAMAISLWAMVTHFACLGSTLHGVAFGRPGPSPLFTLYDCLCYW